VLRLLAAGHTNPEIAALLFLSPRTIESHRANILRKLGVRSRADLVRAAAEIGSVEDQDDQQPSDEDEEP
jgi:DNA-binding CsgD family transcriptional regulator